MPAEKSKSYVRKHILYFVVVVTFRVLFIERADIKGVSGVDFAAGRDQRGRILLLVHLVPVDAPEEGVVL